MDQLNRLQATDLIFLAPELTLVIFAVFLSVMDLVMPKQTSRNVLGWLSLLGIIISGVFVVNHIQMINPMQVNPNVAEAIGSIQLLNQSYRIDDFANLFKLLFLGATGLIIFMSLGSVKKEDVPHIGEFYYLFLPATLGAMIMASSGDLITLFVGLELLSITSYILVGMRKKHMASNEASFKYVVMGGISSAIILYGMSFLYGITGSTNIPNINHLLSNSHQSFEGIIYIAFFLLLAGFGFKIAAAPFHAWAPDVYEGAPSPVTAFLAVVSKAAGFAIMFRVMYGVFGMNQLIFTDLHKDMFLAINVVAVTAMIIGNAIALRQNNMKRLLAYSGIANAGYILVPIGIHFSLFQYSNFSQLMFYLIAYLFMNIGAIAVLMIVSQSSRNENISSFAGLYYRAPYTAIAMVILLLSLAGIPVTGGFFGKFFILLGALQTQHYWLPIIMIVTSIVSYYYYFGVIRQMFMRVSDQGQISITAPLAITVWICTLATLLLGFFPHWIIRYIDQIFSITKDLFIM